MSGKFEGGFIYFPLEALPPFWAEGLAVELTGGLDAAGVAADFAEGTCALTLVPSCSLSTPGHDHNFTRHQPGGDFGIVAFRGADHDRTYGHR